MFLLIEKGLFLLIRMISILFDLYDNKKSIFLHKIKRM